MSTVTKTAFANLRQNKSRNILCGIAVLLTTLLIFLILNIGTGMVTVQFAGVNRYYPTYHFMFRQVSQENADALKSHDDIESIGLREDFAQIPDDDATIIMMALDSEGLALNKVSLEEGSLPHAENEIAVCRSMLDDLGMEAEVGDEITLPFQLYEGNGLGYEIRDTFRISGFLDQSDTAASDKSYAAITTMAYMEKTVPAEQREYRVMIRLSGVRGMTSDAIEERAREIGADFGIDETNIVCNDDYLAANYTDPSLTAGMTAIVLVIVLAGILTSYSIYYVSMVPRVQEYGKLKAPGATKRGSVPVPSLGLSADHRSCPCHSIPCPCTPHEDCLKDLSRGSHTVSGNGQGKEETAQGLPGYEPVPPDVCQSLPQPEAHRPHCRHTERRRHPVHDRGIHFKLRGSEGDRTRRYRIGSQDLYRKLGR